MDASKKQFTYIKNGEVLREQEGLSAKVEHEADELLQEIMGEIGSDTENKRDKPAVTKSDKEIAQLLIDVCNAFLNGPLSFKPKEELHSGTACSSDISKVHGLAESARETKCHAGEAEVTEAGDEASVSGAASVSRSKERKEESSLDNHNYSYGIEKVDASAESAGKAKLQIGNTEVAKAGYDASVSGAASVLHTKEKKVESSSNNSYKYSSTTSKVEASGEFKGESQGQVTAGRGKKNVEASYRGHVNLQGKAGASATKMQKEWSTLNGERKGSMKVAELKVEAQAKAEMYGKVEIGGSKKFAMEVELQTKATSNAEVVGLCGKADLTLRKKEETGLHVPGFEITCGKGQAEATAKLDLKSNKFGNKKGEAKAKAKVEGVRVAALGVDVQAEEECMKLKADLGIKMAEIKAVNAKVVGRKEGIDAGVEAKVRGFKLNAFNAEVIGIDNSKKAKVEADAGTYANFGNIQVTGLGSQSAHCEVNASAGVSVGNIAVGISRNTGTETPNIQRAYGNVNLMLGPPSLPSFGNIGGNFNIGIPFLSAGGGSGGGGGNDGTKAKQSDSGNVHGKPGEASGCEIKSATGEYNTTSQGGSVNNRGDDTDPSAGMNHYVGQRGDYGNCDYGSYSGSHTGPQTVTDAQYGRLYGYGYGTASNEGVYSGAAEEQHVIEHGAGYTVDVSAGLDHDASQEGDYANSKYVSRSGSQTGPQIVTNIPNGRVYGYGFGTASDDGVHSEVAEEEHVIEHGTGNTVDVGAGIDPDVSQECDYENREYVSHSRSVKRGIDYDVSQNATYGNSQHEIRSDSHTVAHSGAVNGYRYGNANDGAEYSEVTQQENVKCGASYTVAANGGIGHDGSQKGSFKSHGSMGGNGRGVDREARQPGNNGSLLYGNDTEMNGEFRGNTAGYGPDSKTYAINSEAGGLSKVQIVDGSSATHNRNAQTQATRYGGKGNCGVNNASTDDKMTHTYTERVMGLADKKMAKKFGESSAPRQRRNEAKPSQRTDPIDKEQIKRYLKTTYIPASYSGSDKRNRRPSTEEDDHAMYSTEDEKHSKPRRKVSPKKPFGEKKNIHTIFTLSEGDTRPIRHIKGNVVCFGDE